MKYVFKLLIACSCCALFFAEFARAQDPESRPDPNQPTQVELTVSPAAEPRPALKYSLAIGSRERTPGNAVPFYHRALLLQRGIPESHHKKLNDNELRWAEKPLTDKDRQEIKEFLTAYTTTFHELKVAVYREYCDWDFRIQELKGMDAISFILPEIQESRSLARVLRLKAHLEISERRYDDAVETLRWGYQLAQDTGRPPLLICNLVGIAISAVMNEPLVELLEAPGAPNMYWAIAALPQPMVDVRKALEFERGFPEQIFPFLKDAETVERSPQEWQRILEQSVANIGQLTSDLQMTNANTPEWMQRAGVVMMLAKVYPRAKQDLVASGMDAKKVEEMSVAQVVAIQTARHTRESYDDVFKAMLLPYPESLKVAMKLEELNRKRTSSTVFMGTQGLPIAQMLMPATISVKRAEIRGPRQFAVLQVAEAIRMHAAKTGELPETLSEISVVPVPVNPVTREPFPYRLTDSGAMLEMPTLSDETPKSLAKNYLITLRK
jgi:hypothetical protein